MTSTTYVTNRQGLVSVGEGALRATALDIAEAALAAADPGPATQRSVTLTGDVLTIDGRDYSLAGRRVFVIGAGKASFAIAKALDDLLGVRIHRGLVTLKEGQSGAYGNITLGHAAHPLPNAASIRAATQTMALLCDVQAGDLVIACFTGGSSSLFAAPVGGVSLADKVATSETLLGCGANIFEINAVRKHLSLVKGGLLAAQLPAGCTVINLTVSDVIGDRLDFITDPTVPDTTRFKTACDTLDKFRLWDRLPVSVTAHLRRGAGEQETADEARLSHLNIQNVILVSAEAACIAAVSAAQTRGIEPVLLSTSYEGESAALGRSFGDQALDILAGKTGTSRPALLVGGGEGTVFLGDGPRGAGGPNQEFATAAALRLAGQPGVVVLAMDTDGTDGPTDLAGGIVDGTSCARAAVGGIDLASALACHDVAPALTANNDAIVTGATGTNVNDLKLMLVS